jgi:mRNA-degrading endonuclease RelE of RelBE toxin-antitoxin system
MFRLTMHRDAEDDLDRLFTDDPDAAADVAVLIEEIAGDQYRLDSLSIDGHVDDRMDVAMFRSMQKRRLNLWRLKAGELSADWLSYRIIYAFDAPKKAYHILAIIHRGTDYERDRPLIDRLERAYHGLGLPMLPG